MQEAADSIRSFAAYVMPHQFDSVEGWELQNLLLIAACMVDAAMARCESRGVHFRTDFPTRDDENWRVHTVSRVDGSKVDLSYRPVIVDPLTNEDEGGISLKKIAPKARTF